MIRTIEAALGRARLGRWSHGIAHTAPLLGRNTPLDMVMGGIELDAISFAFLFAVGESSGVFFLSQHIVAF